MTTLSSPALASKPVDSDRDPVTHEHEPPGACSGPLPPQGGHSPARPSASAGAPPGLPPKEVV